MGECQSTCNQILNGNNDITLDNVQKNKGLKQSGSQVSSMKSSMVRKAGLSSSHTQQKIDDNYFQFKFDNGAIYQGEAVDDKRQGWGRQQNADGSIYEGNWKDDMANGRGKLIQADGAIYQGDFKNDVSEGYGKFIGADKTYTHEGLYQNDLPHGLGKETKAGSYVYNGNFSYGKKDGFGRIQFQNQTIYEGTWKQDQLQGTGTLYTENMKYTGTVKAGKLHGKGVCKWLDGKEYDGQYFDGKKHGLGTYKYKDGSYYKGYWQNGKQHGKGQFYSNNNELLKKGQWKYGKYVQ